MVLGDGRLSLEQEPDQHFDLFVLDAFSGDAVPTHLLTREAFEIYLRHLQPDALVAINISNRYLDLAPVVDGAWPRLLGCGTPRRLGGRPVQGQFPADWLLLSRSAAGDQLAAVTPGKKVLWTDDRSNLFEILK